MEISTNFIAKLLNTYLDSKEAKENEQTKSEAENLGISLLNKQTIEVDGASYEKALQNFISLFETAMKDNVLVSTKVNTDEAQETDKSDKKSNSTMSKSEYEKLMTEMENANDSKNRSDKVFTIDDLNKYVGLSGTSQAFKEMFAPLTGIKDEGLKQYVLDSLGGKINVDDFTEKLDTDGDGVVSKKEMQTYVDFVKGFYAADQTGPSKKGKNRDQLIGFEEATKVPEVRANLDLWDKCPKTDGKYINLSDLWATIQKENANNAAKEKLQTKSYAESAEGKKEQFNLIMDEAKSLNGNKNFFGSDINVSKAAEANDKATAEFFSVITGIKDEGLRNYVCAALGGSTGGTVNSEQLASVCDMDGDGAVTKEELQKFVDFATSFYAADQTGPSEKGKNRDRLVGFEEAVKIPEIRKNLDIWDNAPKVDGKYVKLEELWQFMNKNNSKQAK